MPMYNRMLILFSNASSLNICLEQWKPGWKLPNIIKFNYVSNWKTVLIL